MNYHKDIKTNDNIDDLIIKNKDNPIIDIIIETPDYSYWFNQDPLDYKRLKNKPF
jgi:hypothetical protein